MDGGAPLALSVALRHDLRAASWARRALLVGVAAWLAYEWGPGNETVTPWLLARLLRDHDGAAAVGVTVAVGWAFTTIQQLASGLTALAGFALFERTAEAAWHRLVAARPHPPGGWRTLGWPGRAALVFGLGTTAVALVEVVTSGRSAARNHRRVILASAVLCGAVVAAIAALTSVVVVLGRRVHALRGPTDALLDVLGSPLFWLGLLALAGVASHVRARSSRRAAVPEEVG